jgi:glycosyltransferase involved in cell wall biosynthesis
MKRGVDTTLFHPAKRARKGGPFRVGYVGRLTPEKNVRFLAEVGHRLARERTEFEMFIVGEGNESAWLRANVPNARLTGVLRGEELARAYADMDLFAFPSMTDTYGNVILEAMASGVPCVVTNCGGPKFLVTDGVTGLVGAGNSDFIACVETIARTPAVHRQMKVAAREFAMRQSWDSVFEAVYEAYSACLPAACAA